MRIHVLVFALVLAVACNKRDEFVKDDVASLEGYPLPAKRKTFRANVTIGDSQTWKYVIPDKTPEQVAEELRPALQEAGWTITKDGPDELRNGGVEIDSERAGKLYSMRVWWDPEGKRTVLDLDVTATK